jgi:hypothetical protein
LANIFIGLWENQTQYQRIKKFNDFNGAAENHNSFFVSVRKCQKNGGGFETRPYNGIKG